MHYWNTTWIDSIMQHDNFQNFRKIYLHVFDVDKMPGIEEPVPSFIIDTIKKSAAHNFVPIAYITSEALKFYTENKTEHLLAARISRLLEKLSSRNDVVFKQFVLDFDWTATNQESYFRLLDTLKKTLEHQDISLAATLRLHQLSVDDKMQAPEIDTLLLMCYNMESPKLEGRHNSIFSAPVFQEYASRIPDYPRALEYIVPVYSQILLFRNGEYLGLVRDRGAGFLDNQKLLKKSSQNIYIVQKDTQLGSLKLMQGDRLKVEKVSPQEIHQIMDIFHTLKLDSPRFSIFDAQSITQQKNTYETLLQYF